MLDRFANHAADRSTSRCALQAQIHIIMGRRPVIPADMQRSPEERREILRRYMNERGLRVSTWAKAAGVKKNSIYNFLNLHSDSLDHLTYAKLAREQGIPVHRLTGDSPEPPSPTSLWVAGHVEAGSFREAVEWDRSEWYAVDVPVPQRFRGVAKALEVRGPSMNLEYPEGSVVIWVDMLSFRAPQNDDHVIVYAHRQDGTIEATVKELRIVNGKQWLWPRSSDPEHQTPIEVENPGPEIKSIEITGIVLGGYKARVF